MRTWSTLFLLGVTALLGWKTVAAHQAAATLRERTAVIANASTRAVRVIDSPIVTRAADLFAGYRRECEPERAGQLLVLVVGSASAKSRAFSRGWAPVLRRTLRPDRRLWVVTDRPVDFARELASIAPAFSCLLTVNDAEQFGVATGLRPVPAALLFRDGDLQLMGSGELPERAYVEFERVLSGTSAAQPFPFRFETPGDPLDAEGAAK